MDEGNMYSAGQDPQAQQFGQVPQGQEPQQFGQAPQGQQPQQFGQVPQGQQPQQFGQTPGGIPQPQSGGYPEYRQILEGKRKKGGWAGKAGFFILGLAAGIALLFIASRLFPMHIAATQGAGSSEEGSVVNRNSMNKLDVLEQYIREYYYEPEDIKEETLENGMYKGLMSSLGDPYTEYYTKDEYKSLTEDTTGIYKGIGAYIGLQEGTGAPMFTSIMPGTPAEEAGLKAGDIICEVNGTDTLSMSTSDVAALVKGEEGTTVDIKVSRDGQYITVTATRRTINVPTVDSKMLDGKIGYLAITQFDDVTPAQFDENLAELKKQGMTSLIIDLRNNPGGTVSAVTQIASELLPEGLIFYMEDKNGRREEYKCPGADFNLPLAVLVNEYSASASEILSGAIQDAGIGKLVGVTTYGKGIVQNLYPLDDGTALKITVADYYTRAGRNIHKVGIEPDVVVEYDSEAFEKDGTDNQLEKAIEIVTGK